MNKRSTMLVALGVVIFVVGAGVVVLALRGTSKAAAQTEVTSPLRAQAPVVVATKAMAAGTTGEALVEQQAVKLAPAPAGSYRTDDLTSLQSLEQEALLTPVAAGEPIESSQLKVANGPLSPPAGQESIAITLPNGVSGVAGYLSPGDQVNVYANVTKASGTAAAGAPTLPCTAFLASSLEVLDVSVQTPAYRSTPTATGRAVPSSMTVLLAATPAQARQLVFYTENESLYLTEAGTGETPLNTASCSALITTPQLTPAS